MSACTLSIIPAPYSEGGARGWRASCTRCAAWREFLFADAEPGTDPHTLAAAWATVHVAEHPIRFLATNMTDRKRCDECRGLVPVDECEAHAFDEHNVPADRVSVDGWSLV